MSEEKVVVERHTNTLFGLIFLNRIEKSPYLFVSELGLIHALQKRKKKIESSSRVTFNIFMPECFGRQVL